MSRLPRTRVLGATVAMAIGLAMMAPAAAASGQSGPHDVVPRAAPGCGDVWGVSAICDAATDPFEAAADAVAGVAGEVAQSVFDQFATWIVDAAGTFAAALGSFVDDTTTPSFGCPDSGNAQACSTGWFASSWAAMRRVAAVFMLPLLLLAVFHALAQQNAGLLARAVFVRLPLACIGMLAAVQVVDLSIKATDNLSDFTAANIGADASQFFEGFTKALGVLGAAGFGFAGLLLGLGAIVIAFVLWLELALRQAAIYAATLFLPLGFAGMLWPASSRWIKRLAEILAAFILSKWVIVAILSMAAAGLGNGEVSEGARGFAPVVTGLALMLMACFAPWALLRVIPVAEVAVAAGFEGMSRRPVRALPSSMTSLTTAQLLRSRAQAGGSTSPAATGTGSPGGGTNGALSAGVAGVSVPAGAAGAVAGGATRTVGAAKATGERLGGSAEAATGSPEQAPASDPARRSASPARRPRAEAQAERRPGGSHE